MDALTETSNAVSTSKTTQFDQFGRPTEYQQITDGEIYTSKYTYNLSGALVEEEYPTGRRVKNDFDANGDILKIHNLATSQSVAKTFADSFKYTPFGGISEMKLGNGKFETAQFNDRLQVTKLGLGNSATDTSLWQVDYEFGELNSSGTVDAAKNTGNVAKQTISFNGLSQPFVQEYKYDALYRLTEAKESANSTQNWKQEFGYDRYGNRTSYNKFLGTSAVTLTAKEKPTIDANNNRFNLGQGYTYDKGGNLLSNFEGWQFTFNGDNKQTEVKDSAGNVIGTYFYDGNGMRVKKVTTSETTVFVYSGGKKVVEYSTVPEANASTKYLTEDHLGTPRVISDQSGNVLSRRDMMPFGEDLEVGVGTRDNALKYGIDDKVREGFTGYEKDKETGLDFAEARMYENRHGRFTAVDPLLASGLSANPQSFNRYVYAMNRPLNYVDRDGKYPTEIHNLLINEAFSGLSENERASISAGSFGVDVASFVFLWKGEVTSFPYFPSTVLPSNAYKHAMIPEGKTREEAISLARDFVSTKINLAIDTQRALDSKGEKLSLSALLEFGAAMHTIMDNHSPAHRDFQEYELASNNDIPILPGTLAPRVTRDISDALDHSMRESFITDHDRDSAVLDLRVFLLTSFGETVFNQAVKEKDRQAVWDEVRKNGYRVPMINGKPVVATSWSYAKVEGSAIEALGPPPPLPKPKRKEGINK